MSRSPCPFWRVRHQVQSLYAKLLRWKMQPVGHPELPLPLNGLFAPAIGEVTCHPIKSIVTFSRFLKVAFFNQILAVAVCLTLRIPSVWYVCCIDLIFVAYAFSPYWFYKEPEIVGQTSSIASAGETLQREMQAGD